MEPHNDYTPEEIAYFGSSEYREMMVVRLAEPGQVTIANLLGASADEAVGAMSIKELALLRKTGEVNRSDWESMSTLREGSERGRLHALLTHRGCITWVLREGKDYPWITPVRTKFGTWSLTFASEEA